MKLEFESFVSIKPSDLPSGGFQYPENTLIKIKPYKVGDLIKLSSSSPSQDEYLDIILSGIEVIGLPKEKLAMLDIEALSLLRYTSSFEDTPNLTFVVGCPSCEEVNQVSIPYDSIEITPVQVNTTLKVKDLEFGLPTLSRTKELSSLKIENDEDFYINLVASYEISDKPLSKVVSKLLNLSIEEFSRVKAFIEGIAESGIEPIEVSCNKCKEKFSFVPSLTSLVPF